MSTEQLVAWKHKLVAAFISGASAGVTAAIGVNFIDPDFSPSTLHGLVKTLALLLWVIIFKGILKVAGFLEQHPDPWDGLSDRRGDGNGRTGK